ncbi:MAG: hypothetical protein CEN90_662 [Parcubacteria group bacterium Licking1014_17]|nr:MAG: hypothetical protein CEN90_662 [Parcubacteria group bacterium Licking1014_17]
MVTKQIKLPKITIKIDPREDANLFWSFVNHPYFVQAKFSIFKAHPKLAELSNGTDFRQRISGYVSDFYKDNADTIEKIRKSNLRHLEERGINAFAALSKIMDYKWPEDAKYEAIFTILPFSPFRGKIFFYSILGELKSAKTIEKRLLNVAIHEISHIIFWGYLDEIKKRTGIIISEDAVYLLKELVATAIVNQQGLSEILSVREVGNPEIRELFIKTNGNSPVLFKDYVEKQLANLLEQKLPFLNFIEELVGSAFKIDGQLSEKMSLWKKHGNKIFSNTELLSKYRKSIIIR